MLLKVKDGNQQTLTKKVVMEGKTLNVVAFPQNKD